MSDLVKIEYVPGGQRYASASLRENGLLLFARVKQVRDKGCWGKVELNLFDHFFFSDEADIAKKKLDEIFEVCRQWAEDVGQPAKEAR